MMREKKVGPSSLIVYHPGPEEVTVAARNRKRCTRHCRGALPAFAFCAVLYGVLCFATCTALHCVALVLSGPAGLMEYASVPRYTSSKTWGDDTELNVSGVLCCCVAWV